MGRHPDDACIIIVGDEITSGHIVDTNSSYLAARLGEIGIRVVRIASVGDDADAIAREVDLASQVSDLILVAGGLGPTEDDRTKAALARLTGRSLVVDPGVLDRIDKRFKRLGLEASAMVRAMALVPDGAKAIPNPAGTAPGLDFAYKEARIFVLPGVPLEMRTILDTGVIPDLGCRSRGQVIQTRLVKTTGIRESEIAERIAPVAASVGPKLAFLPHEMGVDLRLTARAQSAAAAAASLDQAVGSIVPLLGDRVFSTTGEDLQTVVGNMLIARAATIAVAESCTGGLVAHLLTEVPGISACLERAVVAYSDRAKTEVLGVDRGMIDRFGAVSAEVASRMAEGVRRAAGASVGLATTGIAGPAGGTREKPVGLVFTALASDRGSKATKHVFAGPRDVVKRRAAAHALDLVRGHLARADSDRED